MGGTAGMGGASGAGGTTIACTPGTKEQQRDAAQDAILQADACFSGEVTLDEGGYATPTFDLPFYGMGPMICDTPSNAELKSMAEKTASAALTTVDTSCLANEWMEVRGGATTDADRLREVLVGACPDWFAWEEGSFAIVLDATGEAVGMTPVSPGTPVPADLEDCVLGALSGLTFPCLGGYTICPEFVIAE